MAMTGSGGGRPRAALSAAAAAACGPWSSARSPRELYRHRHVFEVIERPHRLVLASTETRLDGSSFHTKLEFTFEARGGKTLMTMTQRGFPTAELREEHERGVPNAFARLDRLIQLSGTPTDARHDSAL